MNADGVSANETRCEKLSRPKARIDRNNNFNAFKVKRGALCYQITDSLNKLAQPKRKTEASFYNVSSAGNIPSTAAKQGYHKLINNNELSKDAQESRKMKFPLDTYARITAARSRRCSKRLHELARPKNYSASQIQGHEGYDDYLRTIKKYDPKSVSTLPNKRKK